MAATARHGLRANPRTTRTRPALSYAESSSEFDDADNNEVQETTSSPSIVVSPRKSRSRMSQPKATTSKRKRSSESPSDGDHDRDNKETPRKRKALKPNTIQHIEVEVQFLSSGVIPEWSTLPYHVLVLIFRYAAYPLYDERTFQPLPSSAWLLSIAPLCRNFAEPANTVLYTSPPLVPMVQAHKLLDLLEADPKQLAFKYRQKVESLCIDVGQVAAYTLPGSGHLDLYGLIKHLPRLAALEFYHQKDMSPYRNLDDSIKWTYPASIFEALEYVDPEADPDRGDKTSVCKLRSWRWSSRLAGKTWPLQALPEVHLKPSFANLQKICFVNYQVPARKKDQEDPKHEEILAASLSNLKSLKHLVFESSTLMNHKLLPLLPTGLRNFELINCWEIIAEDFSEFLVTHGRHLRVLTLNHNQSLSLSFLPVLGESCPHLQVLRMNFTYYNFHSFYRDSEPQYDQLLQPNEIPVWPSALQTLELIQMRKWKTDAAEMFFQSLLNAAGDLPDLRQLSIQAILNIGWRDRATFRDKWIGSLNRTFKRVSEPPKPVVTIKKATRTESVTTPAMVAQFEVEVTRKPTRRSLRSTSIHKIPDSLDDLAHLPESQIDLHPTPNECTASERPASSSSLSSSSHQVITIRREKATQKEKEEPAQTRRSARTSVKHVQKGTYAESRDHSSAESHTSKREIARQSRVTKELKVLKDTAGIDAPKFSSPPRTPLEDGGASNSDSDSDTLATAPARRDKGKAKDYGEVIQGMCEIVEVRIDNLRPTETQVTEKDFLDEERSGDSDWIGDDDGEDEYAW